MEPIKESIQDQKGCGNRSLQARRINIRNPTDATIDANVIIGVRKACQRARRRSSLNSSKLFFGGDLPIL
jgi:hypothetical protein